MTHREYVPLKLERLNRTACAQLFSLIVFLSGFTALKLPAALTTYLVVALYPDNVDNNTELPSIPLYKHPWISLTIYPVSADSAHLDTPTLLKKRMPKIALSSGSDTLFYSSPAQNYSEQYMVWKTGFHSSDRKHNPEASQHQILLMSPEQQSGHQSGISQHHAQVETPSSNTIQIGEHRFQTYSSMGKTPFYTLYHESLSVPAPETYDTPEHQSDTSADIIQSLSSITLKTSAEMTQPIPPQQPQRPIIRTPAPRSATTRHVRVVKKETQPKKTLTILDTRTPGIISSSPLSISDKLAHLIPTDSTSPTLEAMSKAGLQSFPMKNFQTIELLKRGSFGSIRQHRGPSSEGIIDIVTKTIDEEHFNALYLKREATILQHLLHPNIVNIFGFNLLKNHETGKYKLQLVLEHIPGIDMLTALNTLSQRFTEPLIKQIISLLTGVVAYLHHNNIAHRDLKPENTLLLFHPDESLATIKVIDFGLSALSDGEHFANDLCPGTVDYSAPEALQGEVGNNTKPGDIWSMGAITLTALLNEPTYFLELSEDEGDDENDTYTEAEKQSVKRYRLDNPDKELGSFYIQQRLKAAKLRPSAQARNFIQSCCTYDPRMRPTIDDINAHSWLQRPPSPTIKRTTL